MILKTYTELMSFENFIDRYNYLKLSGDVGYTTFGFDRWINQRFYRSKEWKQTRDYIITRDNGCDLGIDQYPIKGPFTVHHLNPIKLEDIEKSTDFLLNPEYLITTCDLTHKAIHYGDERLLPKDWMPRLPNDTCPWR